MVVSVRGPQTWTKFEPYKAVHPDQYSDQGRISIIAWGLVDYMEDVD